MRGYLHGVLTRRHLQELPELGKPLHLALGVFDGVHMGHQAVIGQAMAAAKREGGLAGLLTFDPHPIQVIAPGKAPTALLATLDHKAMIVKDLGLDLFVPLHFDAAFAELEATDFIEQLMAANVKTIAVGEDWRFGHNRSGDVPFLKKEARVRDFHLEAVPPVMFEGDRVSSTRIRQAIRDGNLDAAAAMLGRHYSVTGKVVQGEELGRTIGFPTANIETGDSQLPPKGVWAVKVSGDQGVDLDGVANLGVRPTVGGNGELLEVHLFDFVGDLYGSELDVRFEKYLRPERKFPSLEALQAQIEADAAEARAFLETLEMD